jgi:hypothetical protein
MDLTPCLLALPPGPAKILFRTANHVADPRPPANLRTPMRMQQVLLSLGRLSLGVVFVLYGLVKILRGQFVHTRFPH